MRAWGIIFYFLLALYNLALLIGSFALWRRRPPGNKLLMILALMLPAIVFESLISAASQLLILDRRQLQLTIGAVAVSNAYTATRLIARAIRSGLCWWFILYQLGLVNGGEQNVAGDS